jgi:hypothetical protein
MLTIGIIMALSALSLSFALYFFLAIRRRIATRPAADPMPTHICQLDSFAAIKGETDSSSMPLHGPGCLTDSIHAPSFPRDSLPSLANTQVKVCYPLGRCTLTWPPTPNAGLPQCWPETSQRPPSQDSPLHERQSGASPLCL